MEKAFNDHPYDPSSASTDWPKASLCGRAGGDGGDGTGSGGGGSGGGGLVLEIPKMDLMAELPNDCISKMVRTTFLLLAPLVNEGRNIFLLTTNPCEHLPL